MGQIYMDNSSTSFPKAPGLGKIMGQHIDTNGINIGRGSYTSSFSLEEIVVETKIRLSNFFDGPNSKNVIFTSGATIGLNMLVGGLLRPGDLVLTTSLEHNSVARPLAALSKKGVRWEQIPLLPDGRFSLEDFSVALAQTPRLVLVTHGSNVSGIIMPIEQMGAMCHAQNVLFAVDAAQTAGSQPISMKQSHIDALIVPGHKGMLGPQGIGVMMISDLLSTQLSPVLFGGTGSRSDALDMPSFLPDRFEPGTLNVPGIVGLKHALDFIETEGIRGIRDKKTEISLQFLEGISVISGITFLNIPAGAPRESVFSLMFSNLDQAEAAYTLEQEYGILTRCGLHCSPLAHQALGTYPQGTIRFSLGCFNTAEQVAAALYGIKQTAKK